MSTLAITPLSFPSLGATHVHSSPCQGNTALFALLTGLAPSWAAVPWGTAQRCLSATSPRTEPDSSQGLTLSLTHLAFVFVRPGGSVSSVLTVWGEGRDGEFTAAVQFCFRGTWEPHKAHRTPRPSWYQKWKLNCVHPFKHQLRGEAS